MKTAIKLLFGFGLVLFIFGCNGLFQHNAWHQPIGYQDLDITLGTDFAEVEKQLGPLRLDQEADNSGNSKNYFLVQPQIEVNDLSLTPVLNFRFTEIGLVIFRATYTIDETQNPIDFKTLLQAMKKEELPGIRSLINRDPMSRADHDESWLRTLKVDTVQSAYPTIYFRVQAIP